MTLYPISLHFMSFDHPYTVLGIKLVLTHNHALDTEQKQDRTQNMALGIPFSLTVFTK
jgi:hypothetical protein